MKQKIIFTILLMIILILTGCKKKEYNVVFLDWDDFILLEDKLSEGTSITPPTEPTREGYTFTSWDKDFDIVTEDIIIKAQYEETTYLVKFFGAEGELLKEERVRYNSSATAPSVEASGEEEFSHWDISFNNVKDNLNVYAIFKEKEYTISFYDGKTKLSLGLKSYKRGDDFLLPVPTKTGHIFSGWFLSEISLYEVININPLLKGNISLYARWVKTEQNNFTAPVNTGEFIQINKNPHSSGTGFVYQPQLPQGALSSVTLYDWHSSNTNVATISAYSSISIAASGYSLISATLKTNPNIVYYCIIETSADGVRKVSIEEANAPSYVNASFQMSEEEVITKIVSKGGFVSPPIAPEKQGYIFTGWLGENNETIYNITKDTLFLPSYTIGEKSYAGKTISVLGDSITTYNGYIPEGFAHFYPYPTADLADVNQTWWMQFINHYGMSLLVNNSWSGSAVAGDASSAARKTARLKYLYIDEVKPDVILIFMGANDAPSPYINLNQFDEAYNEMIENIKLASPNSEIILCTLASLPLYTQTAQDEYNEIIRKYANLYNLSLIDFSDVFSRSESSMYLVDSAHPNKEGMNKLAEKIINEFLLKIK